MLQEDILPLFIPIVAILVGGVIVVVKVAASHRERMAMIEQGIHPDHPPEVELPDDSPAP